MLISEYLVLYKYTKMHQQEIPSISRITLVLFCVPLYTNYFSDLHKQFRVASIYNTNVEYQIWGFCCTLFLSYTDNRRTNTHINTCQTLKMGFSDSRDIIKCKSIKTSISKICFKNNTLSIITWLRESNKLSMFIMQR